MPPDWLLVAAAVCGAVITVGTFFALFWRLFKRLGTLTEGIMGKPAVTDYAGETVEKAVPSLQARVGNIEEILVGVADTNKLLAETNERLVSLEDWRAEHEVFSQEIVRKLLDMQQ